MHSVERGNTLNSQNTNYFKLALKSGKKKKKVIIFSDNNIFTVQQKNTSASENKLNANEAQQKLNIRTLMKYLLQA